MPFLGKKNVQGGSGGASQDLLEGIPYEEVVRRKVSGDVCYMIYRPLVLLNFSSDSPKIAGIHTELFWQKRLEPSYGALASAFYMFNKFYCLADLKQFDAVHMVTNAYSVDHPNVYYIQNFVDSQFYAPKEEKEDKFTVAFASRMVWQKGWDIFQETAKSLENYGVSTKVSAGKIKESEMPSFLSSAHVTVVPSRVDTFGLVVVESLMTGTPVITTPLKTHKSLRLPLTYANTADEFTAQVLKLKHLWESDRQRYVDLSLSCRELAMNYDKEVIMNKLEDMFLQVAAKNG
jgi:glycosyltransferase involved in cell wall biosynthesis